MPRVTITFGQHTKLEPYEDALRQAGLTPSREPSLDGASGLLLCGGTDVDAARYGEERHPLADPPDGERDALELELLEEAIGRGLPVLAICRGVQLLNVARGGSLIQHLDSNEAHRQPREVLDAHAIEVEPDSRLAGIAGPGPHIVNSRHHQALGRLGEGLRVTARHGDVIEAVELEGTAFVLGVQWHPEDRAGWGLDKRLFDAFAEAVNRQT